MICENCGAQNYSDAQYCSGCGWKLPRKGKKSKKGLILAAVCILLAGIGIGALIPGLLASGGEGKGVIGFPGKKAAVEIQQVLPGEDGSVAVLYTDGTVRVSGNAEFAAAVSGWSKVEKLYYRERYIWENGAGRTESCYMGIKEDGSVLATDGSLSGWSDVKEIYYDWQGVVGVTHDGRVLAEGDWQDASFLTNLTNVEALVYGDIQPVWGCLKKDGTVKFVTDGVDLGDYGSQWTNVKELRSSGHGFYVIRNDGTVDAEIEDYFEGLTGAVKIVDHRDWIFGISADGRLLTHNGGSIYPNTGCMMVDEPGLPYYGEEVDIRQYTQVKDIVSFNGLILLNEDGTVAHIGDYPMWDLGSWNNIRTVYGMSGSDGEDTYFYGIREDGSVIMNRYSWHEDAQTVTDHYRGWKLQELYSGNGGVVGLTLDGKLVGDGIYDTVDFSVFDR